MPAFVLGLVGLTLGPIIVIPLLILIIHESNSCSMNSGACILGNGHIEQLSFLEVLQEHHDHLREESSFYDARFLLESPVSTSSPSFPFAVTWIGEVDSVLAAKSKVEALSQIPPYVGALISSRLLVSRKCLALHPECYQHSTLHTVFIQNPDDPSLFSGVSFNLLLRMTADRGYAFIFSIFGIEFHCADRAASKEYRRRKKIEVLRGDTSRDEQRREKHLKRDKWSSKSSMSLESLSAVGDAHPTAEYVFDEWDEIVDRNFETHITHDTLSRLYIEMSAYKDAQYS